MEDEVEVLFDPQRLAQVSLTPEVVLQRLREERKRLEQVRKSIARIKEAKASVY